MQHYQKKIFFVLFLSIAMLSCKKEGNTVNTPTDSFDRKTMLTNWTDNMIIPANKDFKKKTVALQQTVNEFITTPNEEGLKKVRTQWENTYLSWQSAAIFHIGKAEDLQVRFKINGYPTNVRRIKYNVSAGNTDFSLYANLFAQGLPAMDYLINGIDPTDMEIVQHYKDDTKYGNYLQQISKEMEQIATEIDTWWEKESNRSNFINNSGTQSSSSVDKMVNYAVVTYFEQEIRESKISFPSGARTTIPEPEKVEAFYKKDISKKLLLKALETFINFYQGIGFENNTKGVGLSDYLIFVNQKRLDKEILAELKNNKTFATALNENFVVQIEEDNQKMLTMFESLQKTVPLLKVDMMSALDIKVTIRDNDGD